MKVHLKLTVLDRIREKLSNVERQNRKAEAITVTRAEYAELQADERLWGVLGRPCFNFVPGPGTEPDARVYHTRDFHPLVGSQYRHHRTIRVASYESLYGVPLFVVPEGYVE